MQYADQENERQEAEFLIYARQLKGQIIEDLKRLSGAIYVEPHWVYEERKNEDEFLPHSYWLGEDYTTAKFAQDIANSGKGKIGLQYIDFELQELTCRIKENPFSQGNVMPIIFADVNDEEDFWDADVDDIHTGDKVVMRHRIEVERIQRKWLVGLKQRLFIEINAIKQGKDQTQELEPLGKGDPSFNEVFKDYMPLKGSSEFAIKLIAKLKSQHSVNENGIWTDKPGDIRGLIFALIEQKAPLKFHEKNMLYRIFCNKFKISPDSVKERSITNRTKAADFYADLIKPLLK
ncbi:hypothetical protein [Rufibacter immobilis]|uniref:hypothetical protein n=1 Tax=Rufibacter immobilis TaxID=1348778 RepID=UPI0035E60AB7